MSRRGSSEGLSQHFDPSVERHPLTQFGINLLSYIYEILLDDEQYGAAADVDSVVAQEVKDQQGLTGEKQ